MKCTGPSSKGVARGVMGKELARIGERGKVGQGRDTHSGLHRGGKLAYILGPDHGPRHSGTLMEFPDGDGALKAFFAETRIYPGSPIKARWNSGNPIPSEVVPRRVRVLKGKGPHDYAHIGTPILVSAAFKDCVERLDPGRHGFFQVTLEDRHGAARPEPFYLFNVVGRIDAIIEAKSNLKTIGRGQVANWGYERRVGPWHCALDRTIIGDRACWIDIRYEFRWFCSERLSQLLKTHRLSGFNLDLYCAELDPE